MGSVNLGDQTVSLNFLSPADSIKVNTRHIDIRKTGIYEGGYLSKVTNTSVIISSLLCEIKDEESQVRVKFNSTVTLVVSSIIPYIVLRWNHVESATNYVDILALDEVSIQSDDLIIGKAIYTGSELIGFNYLNRSTPSIFDLFLKAESTDPVSMRLRIRAGRVTSADKNHDIVDQLSPIFVAPIDYSRIDLLCVDGDGNVIIKQGVEAESPTAPLYSGYTGLYEVTLSKDQTSINKTHMHDVRNFLAGASSFIGLSDTDDSYIGKAGCIPMVNSNEDRLEFSAGVTSQMMVLWKGSIASIPSGWILCDGNNGSPDLTDRIPIHADADSGGINNVNDIGGENSVVLTIDQMPKHKHDIKTYSWYQAYIVTRLSCFDTSTFRGYASSEYEGGNQSHENRQKYRAFPYIMKT